MQEQELFQGYEIKNWDFSPRIYKILAASAIFNVLALLVVAQSNLLTTKGCDSPLVGGVCQVIDTLVVGGSVLTADTNITEKPVDDATDLSDAEIVWVDQTGVDKFKYPEGYFALSNPELMTPTEIPNPDGTFPTNIPGFDNPTINPTIPNGSGSLMDKPQELPKGGGTITGIPDSPFNVGGNPTIKSPKVQRYKPGKNPTLNNNSPDLPKLPIDETADANTNKNNPSPTPTPDKSESVAEVEINKTYMKNFAADVKTKVDKKEVDLTQNFRVVMGGVITKEGKLQLNTDKKTKQPIIMAEGNPQMVEVAAKAVAAVGDSGWLFYLRDQGIDKINFTVSQDNDNLQVIITSDLATPERANTVTSKLNSVIQAVIFADKNGIKKLGDDEKALLSSAKPLVNPQNPKQFVFNFVMPKQTAQEMITRKLNEPQEKPDIKPQSGGTKAEKPQTSAK